MIPENATCFARLVQIFSKYYIPHESLLQSSYSTCMMLPSGRQSLPPFIGQGLSQQRVLFFCPQPQSTEQEPYGLQCPHPPSIAVKEREIQFLNVLYIYTI